MDIAFRASRLEREQGQRREAGRRRAEEERAASARAAARQREREQQAQRMAAEREAEEERLQAEAEAERARTGGVSLLLSLRVEAVDADDDKILLPESALLRLTELDAFRHGPLSFLLLVGEGRTQRTTHCGVREFSAGEGTVGLPRKALLSLGLDAASARNQLVSVKFVVLPKLTFAKLRPLDASFGSVAHVKNCLQESLRLQTALTEGDLLSVWFRGRSFRVQVQELRPAGGGSLIDTDVEVALEAEEAVEPPSSLSPPSPLPPPPASLAVEAELPPEPAPGELGEDVIECRVRTLQGATKTRRFRRASPLSCLLDFAWAASGGQAAAAMDAVQLSTRFPSRVFTYAEASAGGSFSDFGLVNAQELFLVSVRK